MRTKCKLCKVKRTLWETKNFFSVKCNKHFIPIIVLKEHRNEITEDEKIELIEACEKYYPKLFLDYSINDSDTHWHVHLCKKKNS